MKKNLLSISQLTAPSNYVVFGPDAEKIYQDVKIIGTPFIEGKKHESIYVMLGESTYIDKVKNK